MKTTTLIIAITLGAIGAAVAFVLSLRYSVNADTVVGYGSVLALLGVAGVEYRRSLKRVFGRN